MEWIAEHRGSARREQLGGFHQRRAVAQRTRGRLPPLQVWRLDKLNAYRAALPPDHLAALANDCVRYNRKLEHASNPRVDVCSELRAIRGYVQQLTLVTSDVIFERDPGRTVPRSAWQPATLFCVRHETNVPAAPWKIHLKKSTNRSDVDKRFVNLHQSFDGRIRLS
jgi:hypothetical protein